MFTNGNAKALFIVLVSVGICGEIWEWMDEWSLHETPYRYFAAFYHFTFQEFVRLYPSIWNAVHDSAITPYRNLNGVLGLVLMLAVLLLTFTWGMKGHKYLVEKQMHKTVYLGYLAPFVASCVIFVGSIATSWLFA
ncbi:hypothetical protein ACSMFS_22315 [Shewanella xiamenensis]|jgi:hypothetical protein|uniref:hypothetical protein n=1 Tax=Shewanella xiamenensis TaxID=332186 RepID=UPI003F1AFE9F